MKRKDREGEEEDSEEEMPTPSKCKRGKAAAAAGGGGSAAEEEERKTEIGGEGGFLGSEDLFEPCHTPVKDVSVVSQECPPVTVPKSNTTVPQRSRSSSSSSAEDCDSDKGSAMVTARSVFKDSRRGGRATTKRSRGNVRGKGRGKKNGQKT